MCPYKDGAKCTAPNTDCPHWQGTFCELDESSKEDINAQRNTEW